MNEPVPADGLQARPLPLRSARPVIPVEPRTPRILLPSSRSTVQRHFLLFLVVFFLTFCVAATFLMRSPTGLQDTPKPPTITQFTSWPSHDDGREQLAPNAVCLRYDGVRELHGCNVDVRIRYDDRQSLVVGRLWAVWSPGESKVVPLDARSGSMQYVELSGTARVDGQEVRIVWTWEVRRSSE